MSKSSETQKEENERYQARLKEYKMFLDAAQSLGLDVINIDTCARVLSVVGTVVTEKIPHNPKCIAEIEYMQKRFRIVGGETPDGAIVKPLHDYVEEIERTYAETKKIPQWAHDLFKKRYQIKLPDGL